MSIKWNQELYHYGMPRRSGRYKWGSGKNPYHHGSDKSEIKRARQRYKADKEEANKYKAQNKQQYKQHITEANSAYKNAKSGLKEDYKTGKIDKYLYSQQMMDNRYRKGAYDRATRYKKWQIDKDIERALGKSKRDYNIVKHPEKKEALGEKDRIRDAKHVWKSSKKRIDLATRDVTEKRYRDLENLRIGQQHVDRLNKQLYKNGRMTKSELKDLNKRSYASFRQGRDLVDQQYAVQRYGLEKLRQSQYLDYALDVKGKDSRRYKRGKKLLESPTASFWLGNTEYRVRKNGDKYGVRKTSYYVY